MDARLWAQLLLGRLLQVKRGEELQRRAADLLQEHDLRHTLSQQVVSLQEQQRMAQQAAVRTYSRHCCVVAVVAVALGISRCHHGVHECTRHATTVCDAHIR